MLGLKPLQDSRVVSSQGPAPAMKKSFLLFWSRRSLALAIVGLAWLGGGSGCTQVQVAPDVRGEYDFGELQVFVDADFMRVYEAAKRGLKDVGLFQTADDRKVIEAELNARD